jgi:hypothetical protein
MSGSAAPQMSPAQANANASQLVRAYSTELKQQIYSQTLTGTIPGQVVNIPFRNVGLIKRLIVKINFNLAQSAAESLTRSYLGPSNILSNVQLVDLSNTTRINTDGWHLHQLASVRRGAAYGAAFTNDSPVANSNLFNVISAPASITSVQPVQMFYEIPVAYSDSDLRGAIYSNVVNATGQLSLTVNPALVAPIGVDYQFSAYTSSTAAIGTITNFQITVYQVYLDQLPQAKNGQPILPVLDLSTNYYLNTTSVNGLAVGVDNPISYSNFREFLSTMLVYDNNANLNPGTDINRFKLMTANQLALFDVDPFTQAMDTRNEIGNDMPAGVYYFNHRKKPINTVQYGNMQLMVNPKTVGSATGSVLRVGFESMGIVNMVTQAGSLYGT